MDPLSMLRSNEDALALAQRLKVVSDVPEDDPGSLGKLQHRLKGIELMQDISQHEM